MVELGFCVQASSLKFSNPGEPKMGQGYQGWTLNCDTDPVPPDLGLLQDFMPNPDEAYQHIWRHPSGQISTKSAIMTSPIHHWSISCAPRNVCGIVGILSIMGLQVLQLAPQSYSFGLRINKHIEACYILCAVLFCDKRQSKIYFCFVLMYCKRTIVQLLH